MPPHPGPDTDATGPLPTGATRWQIQFWAFQVLELGVAFLLVTQSVHVTNAVVLVVTGVLVALLAVTAEAPLGVVRICSQRLHMALVVSVVIIGAAAMLVPALRPDVQGILVMALAVVAIIALATRTTVSSGSARPSRRSRRTGARGPVIDATATVVDPSAGAEATDGDPSPPADTPDTVLRRAGRTTGAAAAAGKRAVDEHRPQVEDQVKRSRRGAGRVARRLGGPKAQTDDPSDDPSDGSDG